MEQSVKDGFRSLMTERLSHAQSSANLLKNERGTVTPELLKQYPKSPTAQITMKALNMIEYGFFTIWNFQKDRVLTQMDCQALQPGFHNYIQGYILAGHLLKQYPKVMLPPNTGTWTEDYMKLRPNDTIVEYFFASIIVPLRVMDKSDYEQTKDCIRVLEEFAHKLEEYKSIDSERHMLAHAYSVLGSIYISTDQSERAFDSFRKFYEIDRTKIDAIYSYAYTKMDADPKSALELYENYLSLAPKCHEKYANTLYMMGYIYMVHFRNFQKGKLYYEKGTDAEKCRLPFDGEADIPQKELLKMLVLTGGRSIPSLPRFSEL